MDSAALFITDIIKRAKCNANTSEMCNTVNRLSSKIKYYREIELSGLHEKRAKYILSEIEFLRETIKEIIALLHYTFSIEDTINKNEDCINELSVANQSMNIDNQLLKEHLSQAVDGYLLITVNKRIA